MRQNMKKLLFALLLAYSPFAFCENWVCFVGNDNLKYCVDIERVKDDGDYQAVQIKAIVPEGSEAEKKGASYLMLNSSFDCKNKTIAWLSVDLYGKDNKIMNGESLTNPNPVYKSPESDATLRFYDTLVCGK